MLPRYRMNKKGMTVERIGSLITSLVLLAVAILLFVVFELWLTGISKWFTIIPVGLAVITAIYGMIFRPYYLYRNFRYEVFDHEIRIKSGIFMIEEVAIPLMKIQNVDLYEGYFMRKYNLASITLSTAGGNESISYLDKSRANQMKEMIQKQIITNS